MNLLLDTHALLWFIGNDPNLSDHARDLIEDGQNDLYVSTASLWEIAIKISIGKLTLQGDFETLIPPQLQQNRIETLEITFSHLVKVATLPQHHKDPFDRLIIAQSLVLGCPVVSIDAKFDPYGVQRLWI